MNDGLSSVLWTLGRNLYRVHVEKHMKQTWHTLLYDTVNPCYTVGGSLSGPFFAMAGGPCDCREPKSVRKMLYIQELRMSASGAPTCLR